MNTRAISTSIAHAACDVCGRTLLRGERAEVYLSGGVRRSVCELCTSRALHGGWIREGTIPDYGGTSARVDRRRSLLSRLRSRGEQLDPNGAHEPRSELLQAPQPQPPTTQPAPVRAEPGPRGASPDVPPPGTREPRHVRAVPTSVEHKISSAVGLFNSSEHPRTVSGIARSLGIPDVSVLPAAVPPSVVNVVVAWELCWYRYEVDLSDEVPSVRVAGQGYELDELDPEERRSNAVADEGGTLSLEA
ncbi:MAG: hypothetical protein ACR2MK_10890 [Solirubrobacteraceae bacterium]